MHRYNEYTHTCHRTNEHIDISHSCDHIRHVSMFYDVIIRCRRKMPSFVCQKRGVPMPITKTIWWGNVGTRDFGACNATEPIKCEPLTSIYCTYLSYPNDGIPILLQRKTVPTQKRDTMDSGSKIYRQTAGLPGEPLLPQCTCAVTQVEN